VNVKSYEKYVCTLNLSPPATMKEIALIETLFTLKLPAEYTDFLLFTNGAAGIIQETYVDIYSIDLVIECNRFYHSKDLPYNDFLFIASNGGEEQYAFDLRKNEMPILEIDMEDDVDYARFCGTSFLAFLDHLYNLRWE